MPATDTPSDKAVKAALRATKSSGKARKLKLSNSALRGVVKGCTSRWR